MQKKIISILTFLSIVLSALAISASDFPPFPGVPHNFWGTVKNQQGVPIADGTIIKAIVDNESYYSTVMNGIYGFNETTYPSNPPFFVEDPYNNNEGKRIYFYVGGINTTQTALFLNGGDTHLDLVVRSTSQWGNGGSEPPGNGGVPPNKAPPVAEAGGPYFGTINRPIHFDGSKSNDSDGTIIQYVWDFGDENTSTGISPTHAYTNPGIYTILLTVTDNDNLKDNDSTVVSITNDSDDDGWSDEEEARYMTDPYNPADFPVDTDGDHIPNIIDNDDDNDGLTDLIEEQLGSDPTNATDVIMVRYQGNTFFFVDINRDGQSDIYYNITSGRNTTLEKHDVDIYYIDTNNDGEWDLIFNPQNKTITPYVENPDILPQFNNISFLYGAIVFVLVIFILLLIFVYRKKLLRGKRK